MNSLAARHSRRFGRMGTRRGLTLLEVMVGVTVSVFVLALCRHALGQALHSSSFIQDAVLAGERVANGDELLRDAAYMMRSGTASAGWATGDSLTARFGTWCARPAGWLARCTAELVLRPTGDSVAMMLVLRPGEVVRVGTLRSGAHLLYLATSAGHWERQWRRASDLPLAIGVAAGSDTTILRIGVRG